MGKVVEGMNSQASLHVFYKSEIIDYLPTEVVCPQSSTKGYKTMEILLHRHQCYKPLSTWYICGLIHKVSDFQTTFYPEEIKA